MNCDSDLAAGNCNSRQIKARKLLTLLIDGNHTHVVGLILSRMFYPRNILTL